MKFDKTKLFVSIVFILFSLLYAKTEEDGSGNEDESEYSDEADVFEKPLAITKESFIKTINQPETGTFVMFHAPWW